MCVVKIDRVRAWNACWVCCIRPVSYPRGVCGGSKSWRSEKDIGFGSLDCRTVLVVLGIYLALHNSGGGILLFVCRERKRVFCNNLNLGTWLSQVWSPNVITVWEALLTVLQFGMLLVHAYAQDKRWPLVSLPLYDPIPSHASLPLSRK